MFIAGRTSYDPIFSGLEAKDQEEVITYLKEEKIPYKTDPAANAILVPRTHVYEARIALAASGIPRGGTIGFERFDNAKMGRTSFQEKVDYYRALEGELARTIKEMSSVTSARVSIVVPESKLFLEQQQPSTAAVLVKLKPGATFGEDQAKAVIHLVASSVEGLAPDNVTLADADGQILLNDMLNDMLNEFQTIQQGNKLVLRQREFEKHLEVEFEKKIRDTVGVAFGPGKVKAAVRVELDFNKRQKKDRIVSPLEGKIHGTQVSTQVTEESYEGPPGGNIGGVPGTGTNIPGYDANSGQNQGNATYERTDTVSNFDNSTFESEEIESPGKVKRITATVLIDGELDEQGLNRWKDAVASIVGANDDRGDKLSVMSVPFDTSIADAYEAKLVAERQRRMLIGASSFAILVIAVAASLVLWLRRRRQFALQSAAVEGDQVPSLRELLENPDLMTSQGELSVLEEQLRNYAVNNPEELANLIKNWVVEDV